MNKPKVPAQPAAGSKPSAVERLDSWKDIARYLNRDVRTVQRWEKTDGLPVYRLAGNRQKGNPVYAFTSEIEAWLHKNPPSVLGQEPDSSLNSTSSWKPGRVFLVVMILGILMVGAIAVWRILSQHRPNLSMHPIPLTSYSGVERHPAFSPNGDMVAFSWNGREQKNFDIYVKFVDGGEYSRLTEHPETDGWPIWSPDGRFIAFGRYIPESRKAEIWTVPVLQAEEKGEEKRILELSPLPFQASNYWPPGCFTPDGKWLITTIANGALGLVSPETGEVGPQLTWPEEGSPGDYGPQLAPDGRNLAFLRASSGPIWNLFIQPLGPDYSPEGQLTQLTRESEGVENPIWANDREILFITDKDGERRMWRIPYDGSKPPSPVESLGKIGYYWSISRDGNRLVYSDNKMYDDIWRIDLQGEKEPHRVGYSSREDFNPQISPDGKKIAFLSSQEKGSWLWVSEADGTHQIKLVPITQGKRPGPARWSPDGEELVLECREGGNDDICAVPSGGGKVRRLTYHPGRDVLPSWSQDGKWIYFTSDRSGSFQIWKIPSDGSKEGIQKLTKGGGYAAVESIDGKTVFFSREMLSSNLWSIPAEGGKETQVGDFHIHQCHTYALCSEGIYYTSTEDREQWFDIWFYRFSDGKTEPIDRVDMRLQRGISVSCDNRCLLFTSTESAASDLYMVENFR